MLNLSRRRRSLACPPGAARCFIGESPLATFVLHGSPTVDLVVFPDFNTERMRAVTRAAYAFGGNLAQWADGVHEALGPALDLGQGTLVAVALFPETGIKLQHLASRAGATRIHHAIVRLSAFFAPAKLRESFFNGRVLGSSSGHYVTDDFSRLQDRARGLSRDAAGWCVNDAVDHGFMIVSPARQQLCLPPQPSPLVRRLALHIGTGMRLQRALASAALEDPAVEAIFDSAGHTQHARGMARATTALSRLRESVLARERDHDIEFELDEPAWNAVVAGRWSLVDRFDSDGRRYVVAYRNPIGVLDPRRLTPREEGVVTLAAIGQSNKEMASALGVTQSTVATLLATALTKLGLGSRTLLPLFWRDLHGRAWVVSSAEAALVALSHRDDPQGMSRLTPAERAVATALLNGLSAQSIARARNSSRHTVSKQLTTIYRKLGVQSRVELASKLSLGQASSPVQDTGGDLASFDE